MFFTWFSLIWGWSQTSRPSFLWSEVLQLLHFFVSSNISIILLHNDQKYCKSCQQAWWCYFVSRLLPWLWWIAQCCAGLQITLSTTVWEIHALQSCETPGSFIVQLSPRASGNRQNFSLRKVSSLYAACTQLYWTIYRRYSWDWQGTQWPAFSARLLQKKEHL